MQSTLNIHELTRYQLYRLYSIDPILTYNWQQDIMEIFHLLDESGQKNILDKILKPRHILYDHLAKKFFSEKIPTLAEVCQTETISNPKIWQFAKKLEALLVEGDEPIDIEEMADMVEGNLYYFNQLEIDENNNEHQLRKKIQTAFLYDFARWIDNKKLIFNEGVRKFNEDIIKSYIKEVYIKQQIHGWDFRAWQGQDIDLLGADHFPSELKEEIKNRKLYVVENSKYWFLIGPADKVGQNAYSLRRFLSEDGSGNSVFLTHLVIPRVLYTQNEAIKKFLLNNITRIYTLERSISDVILKFIAHARKVNELELEPLLKKKLINDGREPEIIIAERLLAYEKVLTSLILTKIMNVLKFSMNNPDDIEYFYYHLDKFIKDLQDRIEEFQLQPLVENSNSARELKVCLICFRILLSKTRDFIKNIIRENETTKQTIDEVFNTLNKEIENTEDGFIQVRQAKQEIQTYQDKINQGGFFAKIGLISKPKYTIEEIEKAELELKEELFINVVRLAKHQKTVMLYAEIETGEIFDDRYRHYALLDNKQYLAVLPRLIVLPEDREKFNPKTLKDALNRNIFKIMDITDNG